jgi:hypothetical protein
MVEPLDCVQTAFVPRESTWYANLNRFILKEYFT